MVSKRRAQQAREGSGGVPLRAYGVTILCVAIALAITLLLVRWLYPTTTPLFLVAVMVSAWYGGWQSGLLATVLSTLAINYFFIEPFYSLDILNVATGVRLSTFLTAAVAISLLDQSRRRALNSTREALQALQDSTRQEQAASLAATKAKERLEIVLSSINDGFYALDQSWRITFVNDRYCEMVQMPASALLGQTLWELFPAAIDTEAYVQFHRAMCEQVPLQFDYFYEPWNCWHDHRVYPSPTGLTVLIADITGRKQAEQEREQVLQCEQVLRQEAEVAEAKMQQILAEQTRAVQQLRQSEAEFRQLANAMPQIVYVSNADGVLEFVNDRWIEYTGLTLAQSNQPTTSALMPAEDQVQLEADFAQARATRSTYQSQFRLVQPDGSTLYFLTRAIPVLNAQGQVYKWYGTSTDVTEFKALEAELRQKNAILNVINESSPAPIFVKDLTGRIIFANPATLEVLGKSAAEVIGYRDCDLYPDPEDAARVMENDRRIMESGQMKVVEESPDGVRTFLGMKVPYRNEAGEVIGLIGIANDISDRVQLERDRERLLQQEQIARETAERANRIKDEFLAVVSHELRTPLNPILGWAQLLQRGKLSAEKTEKALATIERNAQLQSQLIDDLLDISRILRGKLSLNMLPVDLRTVISSALETIHLAAEAKSIQIQTLLSPAVGVVLGDAGRLQQVIWNLLSNAVKFTPLQGQITVALTQTETHAQIEVTDTGKGIHPDFVPYVFEHFRQQDGAITRQFGGLGLGLAIAKQIVELHGGSIAAQSLGEDQGATFTVEIPLALQLSELPTVKVSSDLTSDLKGLHILMVDDEQDSRELVAFVLEEAGAMITSVASADEALKAIERFTPDLVVSDIGMPETDGYSLIQQIRAQLPASQVPAVALTAYAGELDRAAAIASGFQQHIPKPVNPEQLVSAVSLLCKKAAHSKTA